MKNLVFLLALGVTAAVLLGAGWQPEPNRLTAWVAAHLDVEPVPEPDPVRRTEPTPEPEPEPMPEPAGSAALRTAALRPHLEHIARAERAASWIVYRALDGGGQVDLHPVVGQSALVLQRAGDTFETFVAGRLAPRAGSLLVVTFREPRKPDDLGVVVAAGADPASCVLGRPSGDVRCAIYAGATLAARPETTPAAPTPGELVDVEPPPRPAAWGGALVRFEARWPQDAPAQVSAVRAGPVAQSLATVPIREIDVPLFLGPAVCGALVLQADLAPIREENEHRVFESVLEAKAGTTLPALGSDRLACSVPGVER